MSGTIPYSQIVKVTPGVLSAGSGIDNLTALILTTNSAITKFQSFSSASAVAAVAGAGSELANMASIYFSGHATASITPATLYVADYIPDGTSGSETLTAQLTALRNQNNSWSGLAFDGLLAQSDLQEVATWVGSQNDQIWAPLTDAASPSGGGIFGQWLQTQKLDGVTAIYDTTPYTSALALAWMGCLNFSSTRGRQTLAFIQDITGLVIPQVTDGNTASMLTAAGYSFYGSWGNGFSSGPMMANGNVSGRFVWADSFANQIWLNASIQLDFINTFQNYGNIPFNVEGDTIAEASINGTMAEFIAFGGANIGVQLSATQVMQINSSAGNNTAAQAVMTQGYYFQPNISTATSANRQARAVPNSKLWYADGQSVQSINISSVDVL